MNICFYCNINLHKLLPVMEMCCKSSINVWLYWKRIAQCTVFSPIFLFETFLLASFKEVVQAHLVTPKPICADDLGEGLVTYT